MKGIRRGPNRRNSATRRGRLRNDVRQTEDGVWLWQVCVREMGDKGMVEKTVVEAEGIFEANEYRCVAYVQMTRVPRTREAKGGDARYLRRVILGLAQEQDELAFSRNERCTGPRFVYLLVVPRGKASRVWLYKGRVSRGMLKRAGGGRGRDGGELLRVALMPRNPNILPNPGAGGLTEEPSICISYEQIELTEPNAAALFRGFFLQHGLLAGATSNR